MTTEQTQTQPETRPSEVRLDRIAELEGILSVCQGAINSLEEDALDKVEFQEGAKNERD